MAATSTPAPSAVQPQPEAPQPRSTPATQPPHPRKKAPRQPNLGLAPRCGARTRAGCPCRAPAIRGKLRCRMHGGRSTGPRTAEGLARLRAAHTIHGCYTAEARALNRKILTQAGRNRIALEAIRRRDRLLPELVARLNSLPPELMPPPWPTGGLSRAQDQAARQAEAANLAPWKRAIEAARQATRRAVATTRGVSASAATALTKPHAPEPHSAARPHHATPRQVRPWALGPKTPCTRSSRAPPADAAASAKQHGRDRGGNTPCTRSAKAPPGDAAASAKRHGRDRGGNTPCTRGAKAPPADAAASAKRHRRHYGGNTHAPVALPHFATTRRSLLAGTSHTTAATPPDRPAAGTHALRHPQPSRPSRQQQCRPPQ